MIWGYPYFRKPPYLSISSRLIALHLDNVHKRLTLYTVVFIMSIILFAFLRVYHVCIQMHEIVEIDIQAIITFMI